MASIFGFCTLDTDSDHADELAAYASRQQVATHVSADGVQIHVTGRPTWRGKPLEPGMPAATASDLAARFRAQGAEVLRDVDGPFALAIVDSSASQALLAVDRMGVERLCYATERDRLVFGTSAGAVAGSPGIGREIDDQALFDFLFLHMVPAPATVYRGVFKLPPATALQFSGGTLTIDRYWQPTYADVAEADFESLQGALHSALDGAIDAAGVDDRTGAFLSGGLDSSTIVGKLARRTDGPAKTFTVGFGEAEEYDELRYSRIANRHFGCEGIEYRMTPGDIVDAFPRIAAAYDEPFGNSSAAPTYVCAKLAAEHGIGHLLAGDGGDELFGGNERYVRQSVFEFYGRLPAWLRRTVIRPASRIVGPDSRITPLRKVRSYVDQASIPLPERFESWNFMYREGGQDMLDPDFARSINARAPFELMQEVWESAPSDDLLDKMLFYDWRFTLADNDLRKVGTMCELAGVRVSYPMLHSDVVSLSTRIPTAMKIRGTDLRTFYKRAMQGFLPDETLKKEKHGFGLPFGLWLKTDAALGELVYSLLDDLKKRRIVAAPFIDQLVARHRDGHASYFGYAIWDLAMLEAWLAHHAG